jgi:hypothetical protein
MEKKHVPNHQPVNQRVLWLMVQKAVSCFMLFQKAVGYRLIAGEPWRAVGSIALVYCSTIPCHLRESKKSKPPKDPNCQWIGLRENLNRKPMGFYHQIGWGFL